MISPSYRLINPQANRSFIFKWEPFDLTTRWHYHPEIELIFFIEGKTNAVIRHTFKEFEKGDLVILGANFPHVLQESKEFASQYPDTKPFGLIIQFVEGFLGDTFMLRPEMQPIRQMLHKAHRGIQFRRRIVEKVAGPLLRMYQQNDTRKLLTLLDVLATLAESEAYDYLTHQDYSYDHSQDEERVKRVHQFVYNHFTDKITIADVASIANMAEVSFCRYFKSRTLKTFTRFLNEVRIAYACKLLQEKNNTVTDACFASGFGSLSYFHRRFKAIMKMTPLQYQQLKKEASHKIIE